MNPRAFSESRFVYVERAVEDVFVSLYHKHVRSGYAETFSELWEGLPRWAESLWRLLGVPSWLRKASALPNVCLITYAEQLSMLKRD